MDISWLNHNDIINIIETASQLILQIYHGNDFLIETKNDESPLTIADKKANEHIIQNLKNYYPNIPIISEESINDEWETRKNYTFAWLIDPLDGTKEFIKKNGEFTVNIGLIFNGKPVAGFVNIPVKGLTYWAISGQGAWVKDISGKSNEIKELRIAYENNIRKIYRVVASRSHLTNETQKFIDQLGEVELVNVGSSIKILWVAENKADIYPRMNGSSEWDTCAAHAILNEVGGKIYQYENGHLFDELIYNKKSLLNPYFVCSCPVVFFKSK